MYSETMVPQIFKSKAEVIAFVQALGIEEAILLGNLWLEIKDKVTSLEQNEIILAAKLEKERAIVEREKDILEAKNNEIKILEESIGAKDSLILDKENEIKRWSVEINKLLEDKENEGKQHQNLLIKKDEEVNSIRTSFNLERQELKLEKERSLDDIRTSSSKQLDESGKKIIELQR